MQNSEKCVHDMKVSMVKWITPTDQWIKVNTDVSALTNHSRLGVGGILRDKQGRVLMAFEIPHGEGTKNKA